MMIREAIREIHEQGYCVLKQHLAPALVGACRDKFWPALLHYVHTHRDHPNRGPYRYYMPMPFEPPCFHPGFFFDNDVLAIVRGAMDDRVVADQWGCDAPLSGSVHQALHVDYQHPLFAESPDLELPIYMLVVSFGLVPITRENGPIEIVPGSHRLPRKEAFRAVEASEAEIQPVPLNIGDVLIRHPWALHRGSPNKTDTPRALVSIRYVRRWYADESRDVSFLPRAVWESLTPGQQSLMRFPVGD
jgi:ectoine hydroxylase-related dioxygenase (phytanoyl-CoA dioxygenase family)